MEKLAAKVPVVAVAIIQFTSSRGVVKDFPPGLLAERFLKRQCYRSGGHQEG